MVARFTGASLGLFAFSITLVAGLVVQNPFTVTLSRGITALFIFCFLGLVLGAAADKVLSERERAQMSDIQAESEVKRAAQAEADAETKRLQEIEEKEKKESADAKLATEGPKFSDG